MLLLDENDVSSVLDMPSTIRQLESAFQALNRIIKVSVTRVCEA